MASQVRSRLSRPAEVILVSAYRAKIRYGKVFRHVGPKSGQVVAVGRLRKEGPEWTRALAELERKQYVSRKSDTCYELTARGTEHAAMHSAAFGDSRQSDKR
ncbi:MAG TPA: hypothetical protein VKZ50_18020 [bacterium]|nr:hypothetical protein [bacterium]